jgi:hypothetical protein
VGEADEIGPACGRTFGRWTLHAARLGWGVNDTLRTTEQRCGPREREGRGASTVGRLDARRATGGPGSAALHRQDTGRGRIAGEPRLRRVQAGGAARLCGGPDDSLARMPPLRTLVVGRLHDEWPPLAAAVAHRAAAFLAPVLLERVPAAPAVPPERG